MRSAWFSKKRCAEMLASGLRPFLIKSDAGDIVAATMIGEPDAAQKKKYPDYAPLLEGKDLLCLAAPKCLTRSGQEYAKAQGIPATYETLFERAVNRSAVREAAQKPQQQQRPPSPGEKKIMARFKDLKAQWVTANPYSIHPTNDIMLKTHTDWLYTPPGQKDWKNRL